jgi:hypothetical protein
VKPRQAGHSTHGRGRTDVKIPLSARIGNLVHSAT